MTIHIYIYIHISKMILLYEYNSERCEFHNVLPVYSLFLFIFATDELDNIVFLKILTKH